MTAPEYGYGSGCSTCNSCGQCRYGCDKVQKFFNWLIYIPLDHGKTKCCKCCDSCPPPAWVFFPCEGGGRACATCATGGASATMYYAKAAGQPGTANGQVVQSGYTAKKAETQSAVKTLSTYKPAAVAPNMPVLEPMQFRKPANSSAATATSGK